MENFTLTINKKRLMRVLCHLLLLVAFHIFCTARGVLSSLNFATVNALPFLIAAIAFYDGPYMAGCMGVCGGLLMSLSSATVEGAEALFLALFGILCGSVGVLFLRRFLLSVLVCGSLFLLLRGAVSGIYYALFYAVPFLRVFTGYLQILLFSLLPGAVGYFIVKAVCRRFSEEEF